MYEINITPKATPRPRVKTIFSKKVGKRINATYYPDEYQAYKDALCLMIKELSIESKDYNHLVVRFELPYPKTVVGGKKMKIEGKLHKKKPDLDNIIKGFMDGLTQSGVLLTDDSSVGFVQMMKVYTTNDIGSIKFKLSVYEG